MYEMSSLMSVELYSYSVYYICDLDRNSLLDIENSVLTN